MKSRILRLFAAMLILVMTAACSKSGQESSGQQAPKGGQGLALNTKKKITIDVMLTPLWRGVFDQTAPGADYADFFKYAGKRFSEKYSNVDFNVQVITGTERNAILNANLAAKTLPSMFMDSLMILTDYAHLGALVPLDDIVDAEAKADIPQSSWREGNIGGKQFFYPFSQVTGLMIVNADYFRRAGIGDMLPAEGQVGKWTPEEFKKALIAIKQKIKDNGVYPWGFFCKNDQSDQYNNMYLRMYGAEMFNADSSACVINSPEGVKAAAFVKELHSLGLMQPSPESNQSADTRNMFRNKKLAVAYCLTQHYTEILSDMKSGKLGKFEVALFTLPGEKSPISFSMGYGMCAFDTKDADEIAFTKEFIKFVGSDPELVKASATMALPVRSSVAKTVTDKPYIPLFLQAVPYFKDFTGGIPEYVSFRALLYPTVQALLSGAKTPQKALDDLAANATELIKKGRADSVLFK